MASRSKAKGIVPVLSTDSPDFEKDFARLVDRRHSDVDDVEKVVHKVIERIRERGDEELLALVRKYDHAKIVITSYSIHYTKLYEAEDVGSR